jgi:benzoylformate decarboxylase
MQDLLGRRVTGTRALPPVRSGHERAEPSEPLSVAYVLQTLSEMRGPDSIIVEEAPSSRPIMQAFLPITRSEGFYTMDCGGLGYGMPAAVGIALAKTGRKVIGILGDGSSMYSIQALWSAAQLKLPIAYVILKNRRYAALQDFAPVFGFGPSDVVQGTELPDIDFVSLARGMGCEGICVTTVRGLHEALELALPQPIPSSLK